MTDYETIKLGITLILIGNLVAFTTLTFMLERTTRRMKRIEKLLSKHQQETSSPSTNKPRTNQSISTLFRLLRH